MIKRRRKYPSEVKRLEIGGKIVWEYKGRQYPDRLRQGNACEAIIPLADKYCIGIGLDIGAGGFPYRDSFPVRDMVNYDFNNGKQIKRDIPFRDGINAYNLSCFVDASMDYIFSSHCLEHLDRPWDALNEWVKKLKIGGYLFLYLPHQDMELWRAGGPWVRDAHKWIPTFELIAPKFIKCGLKLVSGDGRRDDFWSFYMVGRK